MGAVYEGLEPVDLSGGLDAPIALGPAGVLHGVLANGLTYYVRQCAKPKARAALALAVKVGSLVEEEGERGVAHIVEHLAFNATENYERHAIVTFLESIGASFGACQNAYTSCDETVYTLLVPTDQPGLLGTSLSVMAEFAARIRCAPGDLAKERGAVMEELRLSNDSAGRMMTAHWRALLQGCRYEHRLPIGLESVIRSVPAEQVAAFYNKWYRPEHMAVVVVGDFPDPAAVAALITQHLGPAWEGERQQQQLRLPAPQRPLVTPDSWQHSEPRFVAFVDREAQDAALYVSWKVPARPTTTPGQYRDVLRDSLFTALLNTRLYRLTRGRTPPFFSAALSDEPTNAAVDSLVLAVGCEEGHTLRALEAVLTELARVRCHGFTQRELTSAVKTMQADIETTYLEADQAHCTELRDEYVRHFLGQEFVSGQRYEAALNKALLPRITLADVNARAADLTHTASCLVKSVEHKSRHSVSAMRRVVLQVAAAEASGAIGPWEEPEQPQPLLSQIPAVPDEWYTACGRQPPASAEEELAAARQEAAAAAAAAAAGRAASAEPHELAGGSFSRHHSLGHRHTAVPPSAALASCGSCGSGDAAHGHTQPANEQQQQQQGDAQQQQEQPSGPQEVVPVPREPGGLAMLYPGVVSEVTYPAIGVRELRLVNGMRVALKQTDFYADEVLVTALAVGGLSEVPRECFYTASMSGVVAAQLGPFGHKPELLAEMLAGRRVSLSPSEGAYGRSVKGSVSPHDLEAMGQLLHLLFTRPPTLNPGDLDSVMVQVRQGIEAQQRNPLHVYHSQLRRVNYSNCYYVEPITLHDLDKVDLGAACAHHAASFSNPDEWTLVLTGNTSLPALLPLVTRFLATIPPAPGRGGRRDVRSLTPLPFAFPEAPVVQDVEVDMVSPITQCQITLPVTLERPVAREQLWWLNAACKVLETRLLQEMRFTSGDLYTVSVASYFGFEAPSSSGQLLRGDVSIAFTCDPANKARLVALALDTLELLQEEGPTQAEVDTVIKVETFEWENLREENSFYHDVIVSALQSRKFSECGDLDVVWANIRDSREQVLAEMSCASLRAVLTTRFPYPARQRYTAITMMPRPPGLLTALAFKFMTASTTTRLAVAGAGVALLAAGVALGVAALRRRQRQ